MLKPLESYRRRVGQPTALRFAAASRVPKKTSRSRHFLVAHNSLTAVYLGTQVKLSQLFGAVDSSDLRLMQMILFLLAQWGQILTLTSEHDFCEYLGNCPFSLGEWGVSDLKSPFRLLQPTGPITCPGAT